MEVEYMAWGLRYMDYMEEGREEGRSEGREEGRSEGRLEGQKEGRFEEKIEIARKMKSEGLDLEIIKRITGLPTEDIEKL